LKAVKYPADGKYLGSWKAGEQIAQNGRGMQSSDAVGSVNGGNCYACHQITKEEISFGNIGPSLYQYGKMRGQSEEIVKYTWAKIYNAQAFNACSNMPRFGRQGHSDGDPDQGCNGLADWTRRHPPTSNCACIACHAACARMAGCWPA